MQSKKKVYRERWWQFCEPQFALFTAIRMNEQTLAVARVAKYFVFRFVPTDAVYSDKVIVYNCKAFSDYSILNSEVHNSWALAQGTTHGVGTPNYKPGACGRSFPWPLLSEATNQLLVKHAQCQESHLEACLQQRQIGPTELYNSFHNPDETVADIQQLRDVHVEMDQAVAVAYGWSDLVLGHDFHETKQGLRFTISEPARREVLARLLRLNHERYAEEVKQGLHAQKKAKAPSGKRGKAKATSDGPGLFDGEG